MTDLTVWIWRWKTLSKAQNWFVLHTVAWTKRECEQKVIDWAGFEQCSKWHASGEGRPVCVRLVDALKTQND